MKKLKEVAVLWKNIFGNWKYAGIVAATAIVFYLFNAIISNINNIIYAGKNFGVLNSLSLTFQLILGFRRSVLPFSFVSMIIISLLTGILICIMIYNFKLTKNSGMKKTGVLTSIALFIGVIAPGCAACGIGLIGLLGLTSSLASLPFQGREINALAIGLISFSIVSISLKLVSNTECRINRKDNIYTSERRLQNGRKK